MLEKELIRKEIKRRGVEGKKITKVNNKFNRAFVRGKFESEPEYSHSVGKIKFYVVRVRVARLSGNEDFIPVILSEAVIGKDKLNTSLKDKWVEIEGQLRTYMMSDEYGYHLNVYLFATEVNTYVNEMQQRKIKNGNLIYLEGYISRQPTFKKTQLGKEIAEFILLVKRKNGKEDKIPCIAWGKNAQELKAKSCIKLYGRLQSRIYFKRFSQDSTEGEYKTTYEVSTIKIKDIQ